MNPVHFLPSSGGAFAIELSSIFAISGGAANWIFFRFNLIAL
jgi:hypothetical protein